MATLKQKLALKKITENHTSISKAMLEVGYTAQTAHKPSNLTESKGFKELIAELGVTDEKLGIRLNEGLDATKTTVMGKDSGEGFVDIQPDYLTRHKYLETALKLKGHTNNDSPNTINFTQYVTQQKDKYGL